MATINSSTTAASDIAALKGKKILQYPVGLGSNVKDRYGNDAQFMMIRIISDEKGSTLRNDSKTGQATQAQVTAGGVGTVTQISSGEGVTPASADQDLVNLYGSGADATPMVAKKGKVKLDKVIVLPMPNSYDVGTTIVYNNNYNSSMLTKAGDLWNSIGEGAGGELAKLAKNAIVSGLVNRIKSGATDIPALLAEEGLALNPKKEVMFDNFGFRSFSFRYTMAPKNAAEAKIVNEIIETLRFYALPEISKGKLFYILPAEFQIEFMLGAKINPSIPRVATSYLQGISVNYAPQNVWASLPDGSPVSLDISLNFLENELIDRNRVFATNSDGTQSITSGY